MNKEVFEKLGTTFKKHGPEIIRNVPKILAAQMGYMAYLQKECTMVGMYIPKKRPDTQEEIDEMMEYFRAEMENAWKREEQQKESQKEEQ